MELRNLFTFIQVAESNSFTRAAEKLEYAQPTISFQIKQLEQELGVQLFERIGHTVNLTKEGRKALVYAQQICNLSREMEQHTASQQEISGEVRIAMADSLCNPLIVRGFADFRKIYPKIAIHITTGGTEMMYNLLNHNEVDLVCTLDTPIYNTMYKIAKEETIGVHFICSPKNTLAEKSVITMEDLENNPLLLTEKGMSYRRQLEEHLAKKGMELHPVLQMGDTALICRLVEENAGISFLPDFITEKSVKNGKAVRLTMPGFTPEVRKQMIYHRDKWISAPMQVIIDYLSELPLC